MEQLSKELKNKARDCENKIIEIVEEFENSTDFKIADIGYKGQDYEIKGWTKIYSRTTVEFTLRMPEMH